MKVWAHNKVIVAMNADIDKYSNYETSNNGEFIWCVCVVCHDSGILNPFGTSKKFISYDCGYAKVAILEKLVFKDNANLKLIVDNEGQLLANVWKHRDARTGIFGLEHYYWAHRL